MNTGDGIIELAGEDLLPEEDQHLSETDSAMLTSFLNLSKENVVLGLPTHEKLRFDSPMVQCLVETAGNGVNYCADGIAYVSLSERHWGNPAPLFYFCRKMCKKSGRRSILIGASGGGVGVTTYFQRLAADLGVEFPPTGLAVLWLP
jgi:hypothetical protein